MRSVLAYPIALAAVVATVSAAPAIEVSGDVSGIWSTADSPFEVVGDLRVPPDSALVIEPGVEVDFRGAFWLVVDENALLTAVGTAENPIVFSSDPVGNPRGWRGIRLEGSRDPSTISHCNISNALGRGEWPDRCGAIYAFECNPIITHNYIHHNETFGGSAVYVYRTEGEISYNRLLDNTTGWGGGGALRLFHSSPLVKGNIIMRNTSTSNGGGISSRYSNSVIEGNIIANNYALLIGGAIYCRAGHTDMRNNTIYSNVADSLGGGYGARWLGHSTFTNNILWNNRAPQGDELGLMTWEEFPCSLTTDFSTIRGGSGEAYLDPTCLLNYGPGNIEKSPRFVDTPSGDYSLRWGSPCIDTGDPTKQDPDGTTSDIGAIAFDQDVPAIVEFHPVNPPLVVPPEGGAVPHGAWIQSFSDTLLRLDAWSMAIKPNGKYHGPVVRRGNVRVAPGDSVGVEFTNLSVPRRAAPGTYKYVAYLGDFETSTAIDSTYMVFEKLSSSD